MRLLNEPEEDFELKAEKIEVNKTVRVAIHDFDKRIDDQENKKKVIISPKFKVGETSLTVHVHPQDYREDSKEAIAVYLHNEGKDKITASFTLKHASGVEVIFENKEINADSGFGSPEFLSHAAYNKWAGDHGDVFLVEVNVTHMEGQAQWSSRR